MQRTASLLKVLDLLGEAHVEHRFEDEVFANSGYGAQATRGELVFYTWHESKPIAPQTIPIECGVGYDTKPWGCRRVYESEAWRHHLWGIYGSTLEDRQQSAVIPWAFDLEMWPLGDGTGGYVSYLGRLMPDKGVRQIIVAATRLPKLRFKIASTDDRCGLHGAPSNVEYVGPLYGSARAGFLGNATVHLCPTEYVEPLNGSAIEAMLCGTPVVTSDWGGFTETVAEGVTGIRCANVDELVEAIRQVPAFSRVACRAITADTFSIARVAEKWRRFLDRSR